MTFALRLVAILMVVVVGRVEGNPLAMLARFFGEPTTPRPIVRQQRPPGQVQMGGMVGAGGMYPGPMPPPQFSAFGLPPAVSSWMFPPNGVGRQVVTMLGDVVQRSPLGPGLQALGIALPGPPRPGPPLPGTGLGMQYLGGPPPPGMLYPEPPPYSPGMPYPGQVSAPGMPYPGQVSAPGMPYPPPRPGSVQVLPPSVSVGDRIVSQYSDTGLNTVVRGGAPNLLMQNPMGSLTSVSVGDRVVADYSNGGLNAVVRGGAPNVLMQNPVGSLASVSIGDRVVAERSNSGIGIAVRPDEGYGRKSLIQPAPQTTGPPNPSLTTPIPLLHNRQTLTFYPNADGTYAVVANPGKGKEAESEDKPYNRKGVVIAQNPDVTSSQIGAPDKENVVNEENGAVTQQPKGTTRKLVYVQRNADGSYTQVTTPGIAVRVEVQTEAPHNCNQRKSAQPSIPDESRNDVDVPEITSSSIVSLPYRKRDGNIPFTKSTVESIYAPVVATPTSVRQRKALPLETKEASTIPSDSDSSSVTNSDTPDHTPEEPTVIAPTRDSATAHPDIQKMYKLLQKEQLLFFEALAIFLEQEKTQPPNQRPLKYQMLAPSHKWNDPKDPHFAKYLINWAIAVLAFEEHKQHFPNMSAEELPPMPRIPQLQYNDSPGVANIVERLAPIAEALLQAKMHVHGQHSVDLKTIVKNQKQLSKKISTKS